MKCLGNADKTNFCSEAQSRPGYTDSLCSSFFFFSYSFVFSFCWIIFFFIFWWGISVCSWPAQAKKKKKKTNEKSTQVELVWLTEKNAYLLLANLISPQSSFILFFCFFPVKKSYMFQHWIEREREREKGWKLFLLPRRFIVNPIQRDVCLVVCCCCFFFGLHGM